MTNDDGLQVVRGTDSDGGPTHELVRGGVPVAPFDRFLRFVTDRNMSPNTQRAYAYDLRHFMRFLAVKELDWTDFRAQHAPELRHHLRRVRSSCRPRRAVLRPVSADGVDDGRLLAPSSVHRILAAVASFYEWSIAVGEYDADSPCRCPRTWKPSATKSPSNQQPDSLSSHHLFSR